MNIRVLLVEDDAPLRRSLEKFLSEGGFSYDSCSSCREAVGVVESSLPHIVIAEYHLPDGSGCKLVNTLKRIAPDVPVIVLSEFDYQAVSGDLAQVGFHAFLKKPFDVEELEAVLNSACSLVCCSKDDVEADVAPGSRSCLPPQNGRRLSDRQFPNRVTVHNSGC